MEIISYVGGRPDNRQKRVNFVKMSGLKRGNKPRSVGFGGEFTASRSRTVRIRKPLSFKLPEFHFYPAKFLRKVGSAGTKYWWVLPFAAVLACIPPAVYKVMNHFENVTDPLVLQSGTENEFDLLSREMSRFALESFSDVEEDGSISGSKVSYSFKQPVTFVNYTVKSGETISGITKRFNLNNISTIIAINKIDNVRSLNAGKKLRIPSVDGLLYTVAKGDSINSVAKKYNVSIEDLLDVNDLESEVLSAGNELFIPGAKLDKDTLRMAMGDTFTNPLGKAKWRLTSKCGYRPNPFTGVKQYHPGLDMAISQGTPIYATLSGKVVACGWSNIYGNYVIIDHHNGYQSLYGHMSKKLCTLNQEVSTGTRIGLVGSTGYSTGPHLHFTVYKNGKVVDPLTLIK